MHIRKSRAVDDVLIGLCSIYNFKNSAFMNKINHTIITVLEYQAKAILMTRALDSNCFGKQNSSGRTVYMADMLDDMESMLLEPIVCYFDEENRRSVLSDLGLADLTDRMVSVAEQMESQYESDMSKIDRLLKDI